MRIDQVINYYFKPEPKILTCVQNISIMALTIMEHLSTESYQLCTFILKWFTRVSIASRRKQDQDKKNEFRIDLLPKEIVLIIFSHLGVKDFGNTCQVSKTWNQISNSEKVCNTLNLTKLFHPKLIVYESSKIKDIPPLNKRKVIPFLKKFLRRIKVAENGKFFLLTIPRGLSHNGKRIDRSYRLLISDQHVEGSKNLSRPQLLKYVKRLGCEIPSPAERAYLVVANFRLFRYERDILSSGKSERGAIVCRILDENDLEDGSWHQKVTHFIDFFNFWSSYEAVERK